MSDVLDILRKAREERLLTLSDVADATHINIDHLRALDDGNINILPEAYVRAFLREYAVVVGLDPQIIMQAFDDQLHPHSGNEDSRPIDSPSPIPSLTYEGTGDSRRIGVDAGQYTRTVVILVVLAISAIITWNIFGTGRGVHRGVPFRDVVKENEEHALGQSESEAHDTTTDGNRPAQGSAGDSLTLFARTSDSVWVRMMIDDTAPREYLFGPHEKVTWHGHSQFLFFSIGNAGALQLVLNGRALGPAGKPGRIVQKLVITKKGILPHENGNTARREAGTTEPSVDSEASQIGRRARRL